jgi:hypothetical protein
METTSQSSKPKPANASGPELNTYCYDTLTHLSRLMRLLTLFPAKEMSANIECSLETLSLPSQIEYEALSYTWGDECEHHQIHVGEKTLKVSRNLDVALRHLRRQLEPRVLWVDAICINQASNDEKNHQIRQMRGIYSNASNVLVWLGESDEDIAEAMDFLQDSRENRDNRKKPLVGLAKMFRSPWWSRMWVVQEVVAAKTDPLVLCGHLYASWEAVNTTLLQVSWNELGPDKNDSILTDPATLLYFTLLRTKGSRDATRAPITLESLLVATCDREASDPRDHIFALLGLISDPHHEPFEPDYAKPEELAYQNALVSVCKSRRDLDWLVYAAGADASDKPSWCIDFSTKTWKRDAANRQWEPTASENRKRDATGAGASTGRDILEILHNPGNGTIRLVGTEIGSLDHVHMTTCGELRAKRQAPDSLTPEEIDSVMLDSVSKLLRDIGVFVIYGHPALKKRLGQDETSKKLAAGDIWKVASGGSSFDDLMRQHKQVGPIPNGYALLETFVQKSNPIRKVMSHEWASLLPEEPPDFTTTAFGAYTQIAYHAGNRCFFTTTTGYIGCAGHSAQKGDVLCILFGCRLPAILRPQQDGTYKLVTFTYTHDVMKGEFLRNNSSMVEKEFVLQ